MHLIVF